MSGGEGGALCRCEMGLALMVFGRGREEGCLLVYSASCFSHLQYGWHCFFVLTGSRLFLYFVYEEQRTGGGESVVGGSAPLLAYREHETATRGSKNEGEREQNHIIHSTVKLRHLPVMYLLSGGKGWGVRWYCSDVWTRGWLGEKRGLFTPCQVPSFQNLANSLPFSATIQYWFVC